MISLTPSTRIFAAVEPADMRLGFNGLCGKVRNFLNEDPTSGALFLFTNRRRNRLKMLYFDGSGLWVCTKRLESATFGWPTGDGPAHLLRPEELSLLIHGIQGQSRPKKNLTRTVKQNIKFPNLDSPMNQIKNLSAQLEEAFRLLNQK